jgi:hypothetical protein
MGEKMNSYGILTGKPEGKKDLWIILKWILDAIAKYGLD